MKRKVAKVEKKRGLSVQTSRVNGTMTVEGGVAVFRTDAFERVFEMRVDEPGFQDVVRVFQERGVVVASEARAVGVAPSAR